MGKCQYAIDIAIVDLLDSHGRLTIGRQPVIERNLTTNIFSRKEAPNLMRNYGYFGFSYCNIVDCVSKMAVPTNR